MPSGPPPGNSFLAQLQQRQTQFSGGKSHGAPKLPTTKPPANFPAPPPNNRPPRHVIHSFFFFCQNQLCKTIQKVFTSQHRTYRQTTSPHRHRQIAIKIIVHLLYQTDQVHRHHPHQHAIQNQSMEH